MPRSWRFWLLVTSGFLLSSGNIASVQASILRRWCGMITQVEIDGFKNLRGVVLPLRPFQAFAGPNNAGKSNLFDALRLLSLLPNHDLPEILQLVRGDPYEIFTQLPD